jgi:hypothetical protein
MKTRLPFIVIFSFASLFSTIFAQESYQYQESDSTIFTQGNPQNSDSTILSQVKSQKSEGRSISQWGLGCFYGISAARVVGEGLLKKYFTPTSARRLVIGQPFGFEVEDIFMGHFGLSLGLRYHHLGQNTAKQRVMFIDDIYPHDFQTTAEISYLSFPVILKGGFAKERFWAFLCLGGVGQITVNKNLSWKIDGYEAVPGSQRMPEIETKWTTSSYILGFETGIKLRKNGLYVSVNGLYGRKSFASGLEGSAIHQSAEICLGYRRFL